MHEPVQVAVTRHGGDGGGSAGGAGGGVGGGDGGGGVGGGTGGVLGEGMMGSTMPITNCIWSSSLAMRAAISLNDTPLMITSAEALTLNFPSASAVISARLPLVEVVTARAGTHDQQKNKEEGGPVRRGALLHCTVGSVVSPTMATRDAPTASTMAARAPDRRHVRVTRVMTLLGIVVAVDIRWCASHGGADKAAKNTLVTKDRSAALSVQAVLFDNVSPFQLSHTHNSTPPAPKSRKPSPQHV